MRWTRSSDTPSAASDRAIDSAVLVEGQGAGERDGDAEPSDRPRRVERPAAGRPRRSRRPPRDDVDQRLAGDDDHAAPQTPIGCQTVFISRNAAIHSGRSAARSSSQSNRASVVPRGPPRDPLDRVGRRHLGGDPEVVGDPEAVEPVDVDVRGEHRHELLAVPGEDVDDAARDVGRGEDLGQRDRRQRPRLGREDDGDVAAGEDRAEPRDEAQQRATARARRARRRRSARGS